jgi:IS5 family transposase
VHTVIGTAANVNDVTQAAGLLHGEESDVFADAGYQGVAKREEAKGLPGSTLTVRKSLIRNESR